MSSVDPSGNVGWPVAPATLAAHAVQFAQIKSGTMPIFSAYQSTLQSLANNIATQIQFQTKEFDTTSAFNNTNATVGITPAYAYLPLVAGYYQVSACVQAGFLAGTVNYLITIYKNGAEAKRGIQLNTGPLTQLAMSALLYLNGTTDYITVFVYQTTGGAINSGVGSLATYFQAALIARQ